MEEILEAFEPIRQCIKYFDDRYPGKYSEVAKEMGVSQTYISRLLKNKREFISVELADKLCEAMSIVAEREDKKGRKVIWKLKH